MLFTCTLFYLAAFVFLFEVSLLPFCSTHRFRFLRLPLVSPIGCSDLGDFPRVSSCLYTLHLTLRADWTNRKPVVPRAIAPVHGDIIEVHAPRVARVVRSERTRPVVAVAPCVVERTATAVARCGQEDTIAVALTCHFVAVHSVLTCPFPSTLFTKFGQFCIRWHTPSTTPIGTGCIVCEF